MALSKAEEEELAMLEKEFSKPTKSLHSSGLSSEEEAELQSLEAELSSPTPPTQMLQKRPDVSSERKAEAAIRGFGDLATFGYAPQLRAITREPLRKVYEYFSGEKVPEKTYVEARDSDIKSTERTQADAPGYYLGGQIAGAFATPMPGLGAAKAATTLGRVARAAGAAGAAGMLYNPGDVEGEISGLQMGERLKQGAIGAATGGGAQLLTKGAGGLLNKWASKGKGLEKASNTMAVTAAGAKTGELRKLYDKKTINEVGEFLKNEGLVGPGKSVGDTLEGSQKILEDVGSEISSIYEKSKGKPFSPKDIATELNDQLTKSLKGKAGGRQILARVQQELENLKDVGTTDTANLKEILDFRRGIDDLINYDKAVRDMPGTQQALKSVRDHLKTKIMNAVKETSPEDAKRLELLNKRYWGAAEAESISKRALAREESKMVLGLPELITGGAVGVGGAVNAAADGDPEDMFASLGKGALAAGLMKAGRTYGPGLATKLASGTGKMLQKDPTGKLAGSAAKALGLLPEGLIGSTAERIRRKPELKTRKKNERGGPGLDYTDFSKESE